MLVEVEITFELSRPKSFYSGIIELMKYPGIPFIDKFPTALTGAYVKATF
jgi:hypothetical protein